MLIGAGIETAKRLSVSATGRRFYAFTIERVLELVAEIRPRLVLLSVDIGSSTCRVLDAIPRLRRLAPAALVIILLASPAPAEAELAVDLGAFGTVDMNDEEWERRLERIISAAGRHHRQLPPDRRAAGADRYH